MNGYASPRVFILLQPHRKKTMLSSQVMSRCFLYWSADCSAQQISTLHICSFLLWSADQHQQHHTLRSDPTAPYTHQQLQDSSRASNSRHLLLLTLKRRPPATPHDTYLVHWSRTYSTLSIQEATELDTTHLQLLTLKRRPPRNTQAKSRDNTLNMTAKDISTHMLVIY